jgi:hypothetical protein
MTSTPISPKVTSGATWALVASLASMVPPDMLAPLGRYQPLAYMLISGLAYALGAYLKEDPLRTPDAAKPAPVDPAAVVDVLAQRLATPSK